jgi:hypothetical protein
MTIPAPVTTFEEKVERLENSSLWRFMGPPGWKVSWNFESDSPGSDARMPDTEHLEAYILNLRFFIQNNEPTSLGNMDLLYESSCHDDRLTMRFRELRDVVNTFLDSPLWYRFNDQSVTYRMIFEGMIYSRFAHANSHKHALFAQMVDHGFGNMLAMDNFLRIIDVVHQCLVLISKVNRRAFSA